MARASGLSERSITDAVHTAPVPVDGEPRTYMLTGLVFCGICGRQMDSHWVHDRASYRCRHGHSSARPGSPTHPKILYVREDQLLARIQADHQVHRQLPGLHRQDAGEMSRCLRANDMILVCDHTVWAVESDTLRVELAPTPILGLAVAAQRDSGATR